MINLTSPFIRLAFLSARRARRAETGKGFGRQQRRLCLKRGTSRHWNFKNRSMGCKVIRVLVENMKNCHFLMYQIVCETDYLK